METVYQPNQEDREKLSKPFGQVVEGKEKVEEEISAKRREKLIFVGDYTSLTFDNLEPDLSIVDGKIERKEIPYKELDRIKRDICLEVDNRQGVIEQEAWNKVKEGVIRSEKTKLEVKGEEDLLTIPAVYFAPLGSLVVYGQRNQGSVLVEITPKTKAKIGSFLDLKTFQHVIVGGSWEYLHPGHKYLLLTSFEIGDKVSIGVTSDQMLTDKLENSNHLPFSQRSSKIESFLDKYGLAESYEINEIDDFKGNAVKEGDALVVSEETYLNAKKINQARKKRGKQPLEIIKIRMIKDRQGRVISSSLIRQNKEKLSYLME